MNEWAHTFHTSIHRSLISITVPSIKKKNKQIHWQAIHARMDQCNGHNNAPLRPAWEHKWLTAQPLPSKSTVMLTWGHAHCGLLSGRLSRGMALRHAHSGETQDSCGWLLWTEASPSAGLNLTWDCVIVQTSPCPILLPSLSPPTFARPAVWIDYGAQLLWIPPSINFWDF